MSEERRRDAAIQAGRRLISRGERPLYRIRIEPNGDRWDFSVVELPGAVGGVEDPREVVDAARLLISVWLDVARDQFDVELIDDPWTRLERLPASPENHG